MTELGEVVRDDVPEVALPPRWFGAGNLTGFLRQQLPYLERIPSSGGGSVAVPRGARAGAKTQPRPGPAVPASIPAPPPASDIVVAGAVGLLNELIQRAHGPLGLPALGALLLKRFPELALRPRWAGSGSFTTFLEQHAPPHIRRFPGPGGGYVAH